MQCFLEGFMRNKKNQTIASLLASIMVVSGACAYSLSKSDNMTHKKNLGDSTENQKK